MFLCCDGLLELSDTISEFSDSVIHVISANIIGEILIIYVISFRYGVSGFPTLKFFPKANKAGEDYDGGRDLDDFVKFINEKCGTSRDSKGQLTSEVGKI
jgi:hypothetical protein